MTEYDDTLIDMSDVDDKLDDETETSSSEIDERRPSTSESQTLEQDSTTKNCHSLPNSISSNSNPILVVSSKYYFHNRLPESHQENQEQEIASSVVSEAAPEEAEEKGEDSENSASLSNSDVVLPVESTLSVTDNTSSQLSAGELSDTEENIDHSFLTPNNGELRDTEDCSIAAEDSLSESPEASEAGTNHSEDSISVAAAAFSEEQPEQNLRLSGLSADYTEESIDTTAADLDSDGDKEDNTEPTQSVASVESNLENAVEPIFSQSEDLGNGESSAEDAEDLSEPKESLIEEPEDSKEVIQEEPETEEIVIQDEESEPEIRVIHQPIEEQYSTVLDSETVTEEYLIPAATFITTDNNPNHEAALPEQSISCSSDNKAANPQVNFESESATFPEDTMGENARVEEKLRQFEDNKKGESEDTRGTYTGSTSNLSDIEKQRRRNLIFDEERFEETFLKCLICREVYNDTDKLPKMLHCHHTFCMDCLYQMYRVEGEFRQSLTGVFRHGMPMTVKIQCPTCREGIIISESELRRLPNDHTIMELLCFVNQTGKNEVQYCTKHQMQPLNFFCEPCIMPVCCDCTVIDHKESKGHIVVNVDEAMKKYTPIVEQTLTDIRQEKSNIVDKRAALEAAQDDLDRIQKDLTRQVRSVFDSIREILDEREKELYDASEAEIERKREVLEGHIKTLGERDAMLNTEFNELQKAKDDKDISLIFTGHKSAREALAKKVYVPTNSTKGFSVTFQFSSRADSVIKQNVANLGDIIFQS